VLPPALLTRKKQGFGVPLGVWFRGKLRGAFQDVLLSPLARQRGYFEPREIRRVLDEHLAGRRDHEFRLWQLLMFELWHRTYLDGVTALQERSPALAGDP
jgi:asparagine synthase (glutamine-hydrolysing)